MQQAGFGPEITGALFFLGFSFLMLILEAPISWYGTFVIEERFGFNKSTFGTWISDQFKSFLIGGILSFILVCALIWFINSAGEHWWLYAFRVTTVINGASLW